MKKTRVIDQFNTIFAGKVPCNRYNVVQKNDCLEIIFNSDGIFKVSNKRVNINGFTNAYNFDFVTNKNEDRVITDIAVTSSSIKIYGERKKEMTIPPIFPKYAPVFEECIGKEDQILFGDVAENAVIEYYNFDSFKGLVVYDAEDTNIPDYQGLQDIFGKRFKYLGSGVRFRRGNTSFESIYHSLFPYKKNSISSEFKTYTTENGVKIYTSPRYEDGLFKKLKPIKTPLEAEFAAARDCTDNEDDIVLKALAKALQVAKDCKEEAESDKKTISILLKEITDLKERVRYLEENSATNGIADFPILPVV